MPRPLRNLLFATALCSVAPAAAHPMLDDGECPYARAHGTVIIADSAPNEVPISESRRAFLP